MKYNLNRRQRCIIIGGAPINDYDRVNRFLSKCDDPNPHSDNFIRPNGCDNDSTTEHNNHADDCTIGISGSNDAAPDDDNDNGGGGANDYCIFCDSGILHNHSLQMRIDVLIGDFDSCPEDMEIFRDTCSLDSAAPFPKIKKIIRLPREKDDTDTAYAVKYALRKGYRDFILIGCYGALSDHSLANLGLLKYIKDCGGNAVLVDDYSTMEVLIGSNNIVNDCRYFSLLPIYGSVSGVSVQNAKYNISNMDVSIENPFTVSNETLETDAVVSIKCGALLLIKTDRH